MSLTEQDLDAIAQLMDRKLTVVEQNQRRHRRFWLWILALVGFVLLLGIAAAVAWVLWTKAQNEVDRLNQQFSATKLAYERQVAENLQLREQRQKAEKAVAYDSTKSQADHEASLLSGFFSLLGSKAEFEKKYENADFSDPKVLQAYSQDLNKILDQGLNPLGQVMLRNTDPAHNSPDERLRSGDGAAPDKPLLATPGAPADPAVAPPATTAPAPAPAPAPALAPR
jgi:hypothetical protein